MFCLQFFQVCFWFIAVRKVLAHVHILILFRMKMKQVCQVPATCMNHGSWANHKLLILLILRMTESQKVVNQHILLHLW